MCLPKEETNYKTFETVKILKLLANIIVFKIADI